MSPRVLPVSEYKLELWIGSILKCPVVILLVCPWRQGTPHAAVIATMKFSQYCNLEEPWSHVHGSYGFDPVPSHAYNASRHSLGYIIACSKERERPWLFLND